MSTTPGTVTIRAGSVEYRYWPLSAVDADDVAIDLTADAVQLAFRTLRDTSALDWQTAEWDPDATATTVRALIGAGDFILSAELYGVYVTVADNPEVPIFGPERMGYLAVL
jgi:hypothetical protein